MNSRVPTSKHVLEIRLLEAILLFLISLIAICYRVYYVVVSGSAIDSDEAIVGLMAKHFIERGSIPTFYYGQHYMGSFEGMLVSLAFKVFGQNSISLKLIPLVFSISIIPFLYVISRAVSSKWVAFGCCLLYAFPSQPLLEWSFKARGGFMEIIAISIVALTLSVAWVKSNHPSLLTTVAIGSILGLGWWINNQIIFVSSSIGLTCLLFSIFKKKSFFFYLSHAFLGLVSFFLGSLPFWLYNFKNNFISFKIFSASTDTLSNGLGFFIYSIPILIGAMRFWSDEYVFQNAHIGNGILYATLLILSFTGFFRNSFKDFQFAKFLIWAVLICTSIIFI
jgi:hypothetical protein